MCGPRESYFTSTSSARDSPHFHFYIFYWFIDVQIFGPGNGDEITKIWLFAWWLLDTVLEVFRGVRISEGPCSFCGNLPLYFIVKYRVYIPATRYWWGGAKAISTSVAENRFAFPFILRIIVKSLASQIIIHAESKKYRIALSFLKNTQERNLGYLADVEKALNFRQLINHWAAEAFSLTVKLLCSFFSEMETKVK